MDEYASPDAIALRHTFPECALTDVLDATAADPLSGTVSATRSLLRASETAYTAGQRSLAVPAVLTGGRLGFDAPAGAVRQELVRRLDLLVSQGRLQRRDATAVTIRFGLHGQPGDADASRAAIGARRQATTNAVNRAVRVVAADLSAHPLMPLEAPRLTLARRQLIVGSVLSLMNGSEESYRTRLYAHMRVRAEILGDPVFPIGPADAAERQRRRRWAARWLSIVGDHLDRGHVPVDRPLRASPQDQADLRAWRDAGADYAVVPSVGGIRAIVANGEARAFEGAPDPQGVVGWLLDGYRPLVELLRAADFLKSTAVSEPPWNVLDPRAAERLRAAAVLTVADLLAVRGYPDAAALYVGFGQHLPGVHADAWLRFRRLMVMEGLSFLRGPAAVSETRAWQAALVEHLDRHGPGHHGEPLAVAHAMIRAEHSAWTAGVASGANVPELLQPLGDLLEEALRRAPTENRERHEVESSRLEAALAGGSTAPAPHPAAGKAPINSGAARGAGRFDEWYCAHPIATARWDQRHHARGAPDYRR